MFEVDKTLRKITMHQGDTGSYSITLERSSGAAWGSDDRMLYTVAGGSGIVIQRLYRLDRNGKNGVADIEFHNADTQSLSAGTYTVEVRALIHAYWNIVNPPTADVVDILELYGPLQLLGPVVDGNTVRTNKPEEAWSIEIKDVIGEV